MNREELVAKIKSGIAVFNNEDIEGDFTNDDLSNLTFNKCCIVGDFSGANLSIKDYGTAEVPDKNTFDQLRKVYCYYIVVVDNSNQEIPIQIFIEKFIDKEDLS